MVWVLESCPWLSDSMWGGVGRLLAALGAGEEDQGLCWWTNGQTCTLRPRKWAR